MPELTVIFGELAAQGGIRAVIQCIAGLHQLVDIAGAFVYHRTFGVTQVALDIIFVAVAICAVNLDRILAVLDQSRLSVPQLLDFVLIPDSIRDPGNLGTLLRTAVAAAESWLVAGGCAVRYDQRSFITDWCVRGWNRLSQAKKWMAGSFIFCEAKAFRQVGGFNLELFASEEIDLSERLKKVGRETGREVVILRDVWLATSSRKLRLYSFWEHVRFLARVCVRPRRTLRNRIACQYWYDGRRLDNGCRSK